MRLLLDTHVWLWSLLDPPRLRAEAAAAITDPSNELWLSPISVWEGHLLIERGRVSVSGEPALWLRQVLAAFPLKTAALNVQVAVASRALRLPHHDPADRFIAASAVVHDLTLVTADRRLLVGEGYARLRG